VYRLEGDLADGSAKKRWDLGGPAHFGRNKMQSVSHIVGAQKVFLEPTAYPANIHPWLM
jgi:hypothetical protein